jgi:hypothetical protein
MTLMMYSTLVTDCRAVLSCLPAGCAAAADQCTYDYKGIGVCIEGVDDGCLLAGASQLRGSTLTCRSPSSECAWLLFGVTLLCLFKPM